MRVDVRDTPTWTEVEGFLRSVYEPAFGALSDAAELAPHPDGQRVAFTGTWWDALEGRPGSRIGLLDLQTGELTTVSNGPHRDRAPAWSPAGDRLAFLSDRHEEGVHQLWLLDDQIGEATATAAIDGVVEQLNWSPDGTAVLLVVAGRGAELAGVQGSGATSATDAELPAWMPTVDAGVAANHWRTLWRYDVDKRTADRVSADGCNVWEANWAGGDAVTAVITDAPTEDAWYDARLAVLDASSGDELTSYRPPRQIGLPVASPDGRRVAAVQALCSDRAVVAGQLVVLDAETGAAGVVDAVAHIDVSHAVWRDPTHLVLSGHHGRRTVIAEFDVLTQDLVVHWDTTDTCGGRVYPAAWPLAGDDVVFVREAADRPPEITVARRGDLTSYHAFATAGSDAVRSVLGRFEAVAWTAPDGREVNGWLALPPGEGPFPLIVEVHGGPVWAFRNMWVGRSRLWPLALHRGYAVFLPNPRGSAGWGQAFIEEVYGDLGGADRDDILTGIDHVVAAYPIDAKRIGVTGGSYGGYMTYVLIAADRRFGAAVALAPISDYYAAHWTCNIPEFIRRFLADEPEVAAGRYRDRSPLHDAGACETPTLHVVGSLDRCAPPTQGEFFHRAMLEYGKADSMLVTYPEEGHGVASFPAITDFLTRAFDWFDLHLGAAR